MLSMFLTGAMFYIVLIVLSIYRLYYFALTPEKFTPLYWITMGAAAIRALAGTILIMESEGWAFLVDALPF